MSCGAQVWVADGILDGALLTDAEKINMHEIQKRLRRRSLDTWVAQTA